MTVFQRRNNVSLSVVNQRQNLTLKQLWFWFDTEIIFVLLYQQTQHVKLARQYQRIFSRFDVIFWCNFDGRISDIILMYIFDNILVDVKTTQLQRASFDVFLKDEKSW